MATVSVAMIVLNEEDLLDYCFTAINSFKPVLKEVSIVDGFSTDNTLNIISKWAEELPIILRQNEMKDFATQRNLALDKCTGDWILHMDADETFTTNLFSKFQSGFFNCSDVWDFDKYSTANDVYHYRNVCGKGPTTRLFKNIGFRYEREIHEYIVYPDQTGWESVHRSGVINNCYDVYFFDHTGLKSDKGLLDKGNRYMKFSEASSRAGIPIGTDPTVFFREFRGDQDILPLPIEKDLIFEKK